MAYQLASPEGRSEDESDEEHQKTIYRGILSAQIKLVKSFSLMTSVIGLGCQPLIYLKVNEAGSASLPFIVAGGAFYNPHHYGKLMGYDKPLDIRFKYDREDIEES